MSLACLHFIGPLLGLLLLSGAALAKGAAAWGQSPTRLSESALFDRAPAGPKRPATVSASEGREPPGALALASVSVRREEPPVARASASEEGEPPGALALAPISVRREDQTVARASVLAWRNAPVARASASEREEPPVARASASEREEPPVARASISVRREEPPVARASASVRREELAVASGLPRDAASGRESRLARWLTRPLSPHPEYLNHGEISPFVDVGLPFGYRLGFKIGLLDVLTVGLIAQWRERALGLRVAPELGLALYRGRHLALGLRYRYLFHPLPSAPLGAEERFDQASKNKAQGPGAVPSTPANRPANSAVAPLPEPRFFPRTHYAAASIVWSSGYLSAGMEAGLSYRRALDQGQEILDSYLFHMQWRPMTGVLLRFGDPQWGVVLQAMIPSPELTLRFEWRYSLFAVQKSREPLSSALARARKRQRALRAAHTGAR